MFYYSSSNKRFAQQLRKEQTEEEKKLWYSFLRTYNPQFRRQKQFGHFIVDFYCSAAKLVVELDGGQHYEDAEIEYDRKRTDYLNGLGLTVLRFTNTEVNTHFSEICSCIDNYVKQDERRTP